MYASITARTCEPGETKCADNYQCKDIDNVCNGYANCNDESDEDPVPCKGTFKTYVIFYSHLACMYKYICSIYFS